MQIKTFYLTQSQYTDTGPTSPSVDPITPGAWQGSHWSANVYAICMNRPGQIPSQVGFEPRIFRSRRHNHLVNEAVVGLAVRRPPPHLGSIPAFAVQFSFFKSSHTCEVLQVVGVIGSVLGLVDPVSDQQDCVR